MQKKNLLCTLFAVIICGCTTNRYDFESSEDLLSVQCLAYGSEVELHHAILCPTSVAQTKSSGNSSFKNLFTSLNEFDYQNDPILSYECEIRLESDADCNQSVYQLLGYNELVPNEDFARIINIRGEFRVGNTMYKISPRGTYYYPVSDREYFLNNYRLFETIDGVWVGENTFEVAPSILRYNTFSCLEPTDAIDTDYIESSDIIGTKALPSFNWANYPTYSGAAKDYLNDQVFTYSLPDKRRMKTRVYYHNYVAYKERGAYVKCQKKATIGWKDVVSKELLLIWNNIIVQGSHNPNEMAPPTGAYMGYHTEKVTYLGQDVNMTEIVGYVIPADQINNVVRGGMATLRSLIKNAVKVDIDISGSRVVRLIGHDYVQVVFLGNWSKSGSNQEEVKVIFAKNGLTGIPKFVGGQFMYGALDDNGKFGALRVGTAF